jgi:ankyrin repeat protein
MRPTRVIRATAVLLALAGAAAAADEAPLIRAVKDGDPAAVRELLQRRADANQPDLDGSTALHWAVEHDDIESARLLVRFGAKATAVNRYGISPMYAACLNGRTAMIEVLLEAGAKPDTALPEGETALMTASRTGNVDAVRLLLDRGADVNARETWKGQTALMWAAEENHAATVTLLSQRGANLAERGTNGFTALLLAVRSGSIDSVKATVQAGANVNDLIERPRGAPASSRGARDANAIMMQGLSPLHVAIANAQYDMAAFLLEHGADPNSDRAGWTPLHQLMWARRPNVNKVLGLPSPHARLDSMDLAKLLLSRGADPNRRQTRELCIGGYTDAGYQRRVVPQGEPDRAFFLPCNNDLTNARINLNRTGATPFLLAAQLADAPMMRLLLQNGADVRIPTTERQTPLMVAAGVGIFGVGESPGTNEEALEAVKLMLDLGADVNAVDEGGDTALHGAALRGSNEIVSLLVERGARLDVKNAFGWTPLTIADGVLYTFTVKMAPATASLLRELMAKQGLDVPPPSLAPSPTPFREPSAVSATAAPRQ